MNVQFSTPGLVEMLIVAAARELVLTRAVPLWYGLGVYNAAAKVAFGGDS